MDIQWEYIFNPSLAIESIPYLLQGVPYTLFISLVSTFCGLVLGFFIALARISKIRLINTIAKLYISFMRGVPILVILFMLYFGLPNIGIQMPALAAAIIGFSVSSAGYIAEIIRASILAIDKGQWEAAYSIGMNYSTTMRRIIVPQVTRISIPPLSNVLLDLVKGSSLAAMITVPEMFQHAKIVGGRELDYMTMYILVALMYWGICGILSVGQVKLEKYFEIKV